MELQLLPASDALGPWRQSGLCQREEVLLLQPGSVLCRWLAFQTDVPIAELLAVCAQRLRQSQASLSAASDQVKNEDGKKMTTTKKKKPFIASHWLQPIANYLKWRIDKQSWTQSWPCQFYCTIASPHRCLKDFHLNLRLWTNTPLSFILSHKPFAGRSFVDFANCAKHSIHTPLCHLTGFIVSCHKTKSLDKAINQQWGRWQGAVTAHRRLRGIVCWAFKLLLPPFGSTGTTSLACSFVSSLWWPLTSGPKHYFLNPVAYNSNLQDWRQLRTRDVTFVNESVIGTVHGSE